MNAAATGRSPIIEIVGPSGAGKSTVVRALAARDERLLVIGLPPPGTYARSLPALVPTFLRLHRPFHRVLRREMKRVLFLAALRRMLDQVAGGRESAMLIDEGPVYMLSRLLFLADRALDTSAFRTWWEAAVADWAVALDMVVWLDADTPVLISRIRGRPAVPPIPDTRDAALAAFLARYRTCYEQVLERLAAESGPAIVRIDTTALSVADLEARVGAVVAAAGVRS